MPHTLWSRGRQLGEVELSNRRRAFPLLALGDFEPNALGERLMPVMLGVGPALAALADVTEEAHRAEPTNRQRRQTDDWPAGVRQTTAYADAMSAHDELEFLQLELRDPDGTVVPTDWIHLQDADRLAALGRQAMAEELGCLPEEFEPEPWEPPFPRYQIMVAFAGHDKHMDERAQDYAQRRRRG